MTDIVPAFKGFKPDMTCRGYQFKEGETFEQDEPAILCGAGFHAVTQPIHVLHYYPPSKSVYHHVELEETTDPEEGGDSKIAGRKIRIGAKIELPALIKAQIDFVFSNSKKVAGATSKKNKAQVGTDIANGAATASGDSGAATASGDYGAATASGDSGAATASGDSGAATASGDYGAATASGDKSVALASGYGGKAQGRLGTAIFLTERDSEWNIINAAGAVVDGTAILADTFYALRGGVIVPA